MKTDGGMAFPGLDYTAGIGCSRRTNTSAEFEEHQRGLSVRDYFAASVIQGLVAFQYGGVMKRAFDPDSAIANAGDEKESPQAYAVRVAYSLADAMLAERDRAALAQS